MGDALPLEINGDRKIFSELGNRKRMEILKYLHQNGWSSSVKIAKAVKLHTAIVSNFLALCADYGIVEKRFVRGKRRSFYEYKLKTPEFYIQVKVFEDTDEQKIKKMREVLAYCERIFGKARAEAMRSLLDERVRQWIEEDRDGNVPSSKIKAAEKQIYEALVNLAGIQNAKKILEKIEEEMKNEEDKIRNRGL
ncbi:MAG: ArsR family transcriptional regulator [Thermoplasmata archaeon]|nr:ArsR family transcriptional regulator [Thermoplasmata archaeon]